MKPMDSLLDTYSVEPDQPNRTLRIFIALSVLVLIVAAIVFFAIRDDHNADYVSKDFRPLAMAADQSLSRTEGARFDGRFAFETRLIDAEKAVDSAERAAHTTLDHDLAKALGTRLTLVRHLGGAYDADASDASLTCAVYVSVVLGGSTERGTCEKAFDEYSKRPSPGMEWHRN